MCPFSKSGTETTHVKYKTTTATTKPSFKGTPRPSTQYVTRVREVFACLVLMHLGNEKDHSNLINICLREKRVILTRGIWA